MLACHSLISSSFSFTSLHLFSHFSSLSFTLFSHCVRRSSRRFNSSLC